MELLKRRILDEGRALNENVLKVDSFLNHQVDPKLMLALGNEFASRFADAGITRVITIESSGIAPAVMTAQIMGLPLLIMKKSKSRVLQDGIVQTEVMSFTKNATYELTASLQYIRPDDVCLIIDDFLAYGEAVMGAKRLVDQAGAKVGGVGIVIEKSFQPGHKKLVEAGLRVESLARVSKLAPGHIEFEE